MSASLEAHGVRGNQIGTTFNIFMNVTIDPATGRVTVGVPSSKAGDHIELRAEGPLQGG